MTTPEPPALPDLRRLIHSVLDYHDGRLRDDDAAVLLTEWHGTAHHQPTMT